MRGEIINEYQKLNAENQKFKFLFGVRGAKKSNKIFGITRWGPGGQKINRHGIACCPLRVHRALLAIARRAWRGTWPQGWGTVAVGVRPDIKVLYCFHQNNDDSKCEAVHTSPPDSALTIRTSEFGLLAGGVDARRDHQ